MPDAATSTCCSCGFSWPTGQHGGHSCVAVLRQTLAAAQRLCRVYFEVAAAAVGEEEVRCRRDAALSAELPREEDLTFRVRVLEHRVERAAGTLAWVEKELEGRPSRFDVDVAKLPADQLDLLKQEVDHYAAESDPRGASACRGASRSIGSPSRRGDPVFAGGERTYDLDSPYRFV